MEKSAAKAIPNELFSYEIKHRHWTDRQVAAKILELLDIKDEEVRKKQAQTDEDRVKRWRRGVATPSPYFQGLLEKLFGKKIEQLGWPGKNKIPHWKIDDPQNPLFTGREDILKWLHDGLDFRSTGASLPIQILTGLAGVGKSQSAIEYAHNFMHKYHTIIWLRASNKELLAADFAAIASYIGLNLPEEAKDDQKEQIEAVKAWLYHEEISRWLLVFDSADDPAIINEIVHRYVPERYETEPRKGHVIITTRSSATGEIEQQKEVDPLSIEDSIHFLFRRAKISASETNNTLAKSLAEKLGGLPLALEQAGAYIEETGCGLAGYVNLYQTTAERKGLLASKGAFTNYSHDPIAITLSLTFEQIQQASILAYDLLSLFAFYAPDHIPEELVRKGASILSLNIQAIAEHPKLFDDAMGELMKYSLIRRYSETATCSIHPLVQTCLKDRLDEETQQLWAERAVDVVNLAFPNGSPETLVECERYLPHALVCETLVEHWKIVSKEAARLLNEVGAYLAERGKYKEAESHLTNALTIRQQIFNPQHPVVLETGS